jgi:hypothetical protein
MLLVGFAFLFLARETHGRAITLDLDGERQPERQPAAAVR